MQQLARLLPDIENYSLMSYKQRIPDSSATRLERHKNTIALTVTTVSCDYNNLYRIYGFRRLQELHGSVPSDGVTDASIIKKCQPRSLIKGGFLWYAPLSILA